MKRFICVGCLALFLLGAMSLPAFAVDCGWLSSVDRNFANSANWSPAWTMTNPDVLSIDDLSNTTSPILKTNVTGSPIGALYVGSGSSPLGSVNGGKLTIDVDTVLGTQGKLEVTTGLIDIGVIGPAGIESIVTLQGGAVVDDGDGDPNTNPYGISTGGYLKQGNGTTRIGVGTSPGTLNLTDGSRFDHISGGQLQVGGMAGSNGTINLSGSAILAVESTTLIFGGFSSAGSLAKGNLNMSGNSMLGVGVYNSLNVGLGAGTEGNVKMEDSAQIGWFASNMYFGSVGGKGTLEMYDSSHIYQNSSEMVFGGYTPGNSGGTGTLKMRNNASISNLGNMQFGYLSSGNGTLDMLGSDTVVGEFPSIVTSGVTFIGRDSGVGAATIANATYTANDVVYIGIGPGGDGTVTVETTAGSVNQAVLSVASTLFVGWENSKGTLNINGNSLVQCNNWLRIGHWDGYTAPTATGEVVMTGGTLNVLRPGNAGQCYATLGMGGDGTFTQSGGVATISGPTVLGEDGAGVGGIGGTGTLNLNGGVYSTTRIYNTWSGGGNGRGRVNFNGGTLKVNPNGHEFVAGGDFIVLRSATDFIATVLANGAIIDTNSASVIVPVGLMHDATELTPTIDGGLTKTGLGTLTLKNSASTYNGPTVIEQGTLNLDSAFLTSPSILVKADTTLAGKGTYTYPSTTVETGGTIAPGTIYESLNLASLNLGDGSKLHFNVDSSYADQINVSGAVVPYNAAAAIVTVSYTGSIVYDTVLLTTSDPAGINENLVFQLPGGKAVLDSDDGINSVVSVFKDTYQVILKAGGLITDPAWNYSGTGNWSDTAKWGNPGPNPAPNGGGDRAMFIDPAVEGAVSVNLDMSPQVSSMIFASGIIGSSYTINHSATHSITLQSDIALNWHLTVLSGSHTVAADLKLAKGTDQSVIRTALGTSLTLSGDLSDLVTGESAGINFEGNGDGKSYAPTYGTLVLGGLNTFTGPVAMTEYGRLEIGNIGLTTAPNALGQSGPAASNLKINGILAYTGTTSATTDRGFTLVGAATDPYNNGINNYIEVADADVNLKFEGQLAIEGYSMMTKSGPGTLTFSNSGTNTLANCDIDVADGSLVLENGTFSKVRENIMFQNGSGDLRVGTTTGITPSLVIKNNATLNLNSGSQLRVGYGSGIAGTATIESGATVHASSHVVLGNAGNGTMTVGSKGTTTETLTVGGNLYVGYQAGQGELNIKDGANITVASHIPVGHRDIPAPPATPPLATAQGTVNMSGGTLTAGTGNQIYVLLGMGGTGTWNQTGGVATINGPTVFGENVTETGGGIGILNLDGGVYATSRLYNGWTGTGNAQGRVNFDGGTLQVNPNGWEFSNNGPFVLLRDAPDFVITIEDGGAIIDTNGANQSFATVPFTHDATLGTALDGGLRKIGEGLLHVLVTPTYNGNTTAENGLLVFQDATLYTPNADLVVTGDASMAVYPSAGSTVDPSVTVANATVDSTASLSVAKALTASGTVAVYDSATLTAGSIVADTLIIGGTAPDAGAPSIAAVPEPCTVVMLAIAALGMLAVMWRKK